MKRKWLFLLLVILAETSAHSQYNPLKDPNICGRPKCDHGSRKFNYKPGVKYKYQYSVDVDTLFEGTSKNSSSLHIDADLVLEFTGHCEGTLVFNGVRLSDRENETPDHEQTTAFSEAIAKNPLRFSYHDGMVTELCPKELETNWVLNFKRGVLTLLHNTMRRFDLDHDTVETDVHGTCPTKYTLEGARNTSLIIQKTKDIANCNDRYKHQSILQSTPYSFRANYQVIPIIKSNVTCELSIDHYVYNQIICHETHMFQPFSNNAAGAATVARQKLILVKEHEELGYEEPQPDMVERRTNLLFNHVSTPKPTSGELRESRDLIKKLCKLSNDDMHIEFSNLFTKFIHTSRQLSNIALHQLYNRAKVICGTGRKHILDALPFLGSNAAVSLMKDIIIHGDVPKETVHEWLIALSFIQRPTETMLVSLIDLLQHDTEDPAVTLSIATVTHSYCRITSNCYDSISVQDIVAQLEQRATESYTSRNDGKKTREKILVALKGLANIGIVSEPFEDTLWEMIMDDELSTEVRVAAVDTHRRLPCMNTRERFLELFRTQKIDSEVRIAAYLQMMRCPDYITIRIVRHCLQEEEVNQVGSFIWSHLHNLMKSSIPSRIEIQSLLADKDLVRKFSSDIRKFSHNYEGSVFFDEYNAGGNYEANVIFSPTSYVPKSAMLNLTVDIFGESINLFEVNGRAEGLEHYLESVFGPKGPLNSRFFEEKISKIRWPRSVSSPSENEVLKSDIDSLPDIVTNNFHDPRVSLGMKVFGNEIKYHTFNGDEEIKEGLRKLNPVNYVKRILSGKEITYNKAAMIMDTSYIVPCGAGLPLTLNAVGTAAVNLKMFGALRGADFMKTKEFDLVGNLRPSVTVDIIGTMSVDAYYASTGIKLKTNVYSSSAIEGQVKVRGAQLVSVKFSLPNEKTEIFSAQSEIVIMRNDVEEYQKGITENRISKTMCSWPVVDRTIGLKLCADYNFANVTKNNDAPYFILAGPAKFRVSLQKADPTAKDYVFEYKWTKGQNSSVISVSFDTPGSSVKRLLNANMTLDVQSQNLTLLLQSAAGTTLAKGRYKNTENEKYLQLSLDINGKKHFDAELSLTKKESKNGFLYQPKIYLGVNNERVAQLNGTVKYVMKKGVQQWEVSLDFGTKRLETHLAGYVTRTDAAFSTKLNLDYRFLNGTQERVHTEFKLSNRSTNTIKSFHGDLRLKSTAYPQFNFDAALKYQTAQGHVDCKLLFNSKPHLNDKDHILTVQFVFITTDSSDGRKLNTFLEVQRPATQLDLKLQVRYEVLGPKTNVFFLCRYAKDRDISVALYLSIPHGSLFYLEGKLNVTVPSFIPMILEGKLQEKTSHKYDIELKAVWFSGHNCTVSGRFEDKSTRIATSRSIKMVIQSPSFHEINVIGSYYRDHTQLKFDVKADHGADIYAINLKHSVPSAREMYTKAEVVYKGKKYSITSIVDLLEDRQIRLELHLDSIRDIHLVMRGLTKEARKELGIEIKWDVNRDPDQKLVASFEFASPESYNYNGNFLVAWPGRSINGKFDFKLRDFHFETSARLEWSPTEFISLKLRSDYKYDVETLITMESELLTPFDNWRKTSINGGYYHIDNMYRANGSVYWLQNQYVSINVLSNYTSSAKDLRCEFGGFVESTIPKIPSVSGNLKHFYNNSKIDTSLNVTYDPKKKIFVKSVWEIAEDANNRNLTGNVRLVSPFAGYNHGVLVSKIYINRARDIRGVADLDLDHKKYTASLEGHLQRITESMFYFNITTPIEKYNKLTGRFGLSERKRHIVAEIRAPSGAVGTEVLFFITDISDFDLKFALATPVDFLKNVMVVAKLKSDRADFRIGWNKLMAGFTGVWHYENLADFEYSYKIYTPIEGLEENGIVAKFELKDGLESEFTVKLANTKAGIAIIGKPKPKYLKELGIKRPPIYTSIMKTNLGDEEEIETDGDTHDGISWSGLIEVDTIIWPTIKGTLEIDQAGTVYAATVTLTLPDGVAELTDVLDYLDIMDMRNELHVITPYECYKEITSNLNVDVVFGSEYNIALDFNILNKTKWIESGVLLRYIHEEEDDGNQIHNGTLHIHSPFVSLPRLDLNAALEHEENVSRVSVGLITNSTDISISGSGEADDGFLETAANFHVFSPSLYIPPTEFKLKKDFSKAENILEILLNVTRSADTKYTVKSLWHVRSIKHFKIVLKTELPIHPLQHIEGGIAVFGESEVKSAGIRLILPPHSLDANTTIKDNLVHAVLLADLAADKHSVTFDGNIVKISEKQHSLSGVLKYGEEDYDVSGNMNMYNDLPAGMDLELIPKNGGETVLARYNIQPQESGFALRSTVQRGDAAGHLEAHVGFRHKFDWDVHIQVDTPLENYKSATLDSKMMTPNYNNMSFIFKSTTPFLGLERTEIGYTLKLNGIAGDLRLFHDLANSKGETKINWQWLLMENMSVNLNGDQQIGNKKKTLALILFYVNPNKKFEYLKLGGDINVDDGAWTFGSNATLSLPSHKKIDFDAHLKLPLPRQEIHSIIGSFHSTEGLEDVQYLAKYRTATSMLHYVASGNVTINNKTNIKGNLKIDWGLTANQSINNMLDLKRSNSSVDVAYKLFTAKYPKQETLKTRLTYNGDMLYHNVTALLFLPASRQIANVKVDFAGLPNMNGTVNVTTPFKSFPYVGAHFVTETVSVYSNRRIEAFWPNNTALVDSKYKYVRHAVGYAEAQGILILDVPVTTRHVTKVDYGYNTEPLRTTGQATINYNKRKILQGNYSCDSVSRAGFDKDIINIEVENSYVPVGLLYIHQFEYHAPGGGSNLPTMDFKHVEVFHLRNSSGFNVTGEIYLNSSETGKQITIQAINLNRTVTLNADYDVQDQRFLQKSRLQLAPTVWIAYDLDIVNKTEDGNKEHQEIEINVSYPRRNFTLLASYAVTNSSLFSEASLKWDKAIQAKVVQASFEWERLSVTPNRQFVELKIMHPSFERNVSLKGDYLSDDIKIVDAQLTVVYSNDPDKKAYLSANLEDHSNVTMRNFTFEVVGSHPATNLELLVEGQTDFRRRWYDAICHARYKRTYLPLQTAKMYGKLDLLNHEIEYKKTSEREPSYLWAKFDGSYPLYTANLSALRGYDYNASGKFYLNFKEKLLKTELNMTEDGSQSFHMYGVIPDARSATFNVWRDYEDIHVSDVAYYLRLNHSRLVVSSLDWRPELTSEIKGAIKAASIDLYNNFTSDLDYWKTYIRSETVSTVKDIWENAKPNIQNFLDDLDGFKLLVEDVEVLKSFLNASYHANEFYVRDIVAGAMFVIDELSIRSHIESLPAIVSEIWEVMGESGEAIRKSIIWIVQTIKESYRKAAEFINSLLRGEFLDHLSALMERFVEKYDKFVKDIHVWFIKYIEELWQQLYATAVDNWRKLLRKIEPAFITFAHYVETTVYRASKEVLDFLYKHTSEIVESPYFHKFSRLTHDLDKLYKDFTKNDVITLIYKYSNIVINFLKEKYAAMVPFGKELQDIATEIVNELQELRKLPSIQYVTAKVEEWYEKVKWFYDYFDVGYKIRRFITVVHVKLTDITLTALQAENRYREAKTKFIFEPKTGIMHWEQKLPMSWHAFNETPKFEEIPEYKAISDIHSYFVSSNTTFWALYYDYKPYTDPKDWFPPFTGHAMIAGSQHYMTFDKQFYEFSGTCSYLLAHDFLDKNFSVAITYNPATNGRTHKLHLLLKNAAVTVDVFANTVGVGNSTIGRLPVAVEDAYIYRDADILTVESLSGFSLRCNMKFDVCMLDVSGWYFGKTAGLWGTMNNEPSDDFLASTNQIVSHMGRFTQSWSLQPKTCHTISNQAITFTEPDLAVIELCDSLFISKVSPFNACFQRVHAQPFHRMCLNSGSELHACTSAVAYIQACRVDNTPLRIPDVCVKCNLPNGTEVNEGEFVKLENADIPLTSDIVFIVEAKECNADLKKKRNMDSLISLLQKELVDSGITDNRYSLVVFGGNNVFDQPRSVVINNEIFASHQQIPSYFDNIPVGTGNSDIFDAINFAAQLVFRPGASKTFILLPCTECDISAMKLDYAVLHQLLLENDITLHILMNAEFYFEKARISKVFFGIDSGFAYTKKDGRTLKGDAELRRQVRPPKSILGYCAPLALETNGTVFTGKKLEGDKRNAMKKFATVFAKRVARTATPSSCQTCECNALDNGVSYMECFPCDYPMPAYSDYDFNDDEILSTITVDVDDQYDSTGD